MHLHVADGGLALTYCHLHVADGGLALTYIHLHVADGGLVLPTVDGRAVVASTTHHTREQPTLPWLHLCQSKIDEIGFNGM